MTLVLGQKMIRAGDGMRGRVEDVRFHNDSGTGDPAEMSDPRLHVVYTDRGQSRVAPKSEKWEPANPPMPPLREDDMMEVALVADRALRAIDKHEPRRYWLPVETIDEPHDPKLVAVIVEYLKGRT